MSEQSRIEQILSALLKGETEGLPEPQSRMEAYLTALASRMSEMPGVTKKEVAGTNTVIEETPISTIMASVMETGVYMIYPSDTIMQSGKTYNVRIGNVSKEFVAFDMLSAIEAYAGSSAACIGDSFEAFDTGDPELCTYGFNILAVTDVDGYIGANATFIVVTDIEKVTSAFGLTAEEMLASTLSVGEPVINVVEDVHKLDNRFLDMDWIPKYDKEVYKNIFRDIDIGSDYAFGDFVPGLVMFANPAFEHLEELKILYTTSSDETPTEYIRKMEHLGGNSEYVLYGCGNTSILNEDAHDHYRIVSLDTGEPFFISKLIPADSNSGLEPVLLCAVKNLSGYLALYEKTKDTSNPMPEDFLPSSVRNLLTDEFLTSIKNMVISELKCQPPIIAYIHNDENYTIGMGGTKYDNVDIYRVTNTTSGKIYHKICSIPADPTGIHYELASNNDIKYGDVLVITNTSSGHSVRHIDSDYSNEYHYEKLETPTLSINNSVLSWNAIEHADSYDIWATNEWGDTIGVLATIKRTSYTLSEDDKVILGNKSTITVQAISDSYVNSDESNTVQYSSAE